MFYYKPRTTLEMPAYITRELFALQLVFLASFLVCCLKVVQKKQSVGQNLLKISLGTYLEIQDHGLFDPSWGGYTDRTLLSVL